MLNKEKIRNIIFVLLGVAGLIFKRSYNGPLTELVVSYLGNVSVSFAIYFLTAIYTSQRKLNRYFTAGIAITIVELFEITDGFGIMRNTFDPWDLIANFVGVGLAFLLDLSINRNNFGK
jgi:hypothetical protein